MKQKADLLDLLILEGQAYPGIEELEKLVQSGSDLSALPIQPLFVALKQIPADQVAKYLALLGQEQRQACLDLDLWEKDEIDISQMGFWIEAYSKTPEMEIRAELACSEVFGLFLKGQFNIYTFDLEDPEYPEHDFYFLTEDNQLLFEFTEEFAYISEVKQIISDLYTTKGVEQAYALLFKFLTDSYLVMQENEFAAKKSRLADYGFVDYYEALKLKSCFSTQVGLDKFVQEKKVSTARIDDLAKNQVPLKSSLVAFEKHKSDLMHTELLKVQQVTRQDYLQFNFVRLLNASLTSDNVLRDGSIAISKVGHKVRIYLSLGTEYVLENESLAEEVLFERFDFFDLHKIGYSLFQIQLAQLKKQLKTYKFDMDSEGFLGEVVNHMLDACFAERPCYYCLRESRDIPVEGIETFKIWKQWTNFLIESLPYIRKFMDSFVSLVESDKLLDGFYLNYSVNEIDFESILVSSFIHFCLGHYEQNKSSRMGVQIEELKEFMQSFLKAIESTADFLENEELNTYLHNFCQKFGLSDLALMPQFLEHLLRRHLSGYTWEKLTEEDFKHVGGPILLVTGQ